MTLIGDETSAGVKNLGIPWEFARQRPDKVAGCQEVSKLPNLPEGQTSCEEGQKCFYFSCGKCSSILALDTLNFEYRNTMQFVPRITCIPAPETFEEDNQYHGEITEIYWKFLAQLRPGLKGIGIRGWGSKNAAKIFKNVAETFSGVKKYEKTKDFEIDWILFNGHTITIIEVKEKSEKKSEEKSSERKSSKKGGNVRNFESKVDQIKKDRIIMQHLFEVTRCQNVRVNYVIACPNVSISELEEGKFRENHKNLLQEIVNSGDTMSFISEECMSRGKVFMYNKDDSNPSRINFTELMEPSFIGETNNRDNTHSEWQDNYRWLASSVIISMLVIGVEENAECGHLVPGEDNFKLKQKTKSRILQTIRVQAKTNFPECVVFDPEQLVALKNKGDRTLLLGEPGSGKTLILLYLLYKNTAKDLKEAELKRVQFVIPKEKTELFKFVDSFILTYCRVDYVNLTPLDTFDEFKATEDCEVLLIDEFVARDVIGFFELTLRVQTKVFAALRYYLHFNMGTGFPCNIVYLRNCYRCAVNITHRYLKLTPEGDEPINLSIALQKGVKVNDESDFKILAYEKYNLSEISKLLPEKQFPEEDMLLVTTKKDILKLADKKFTHSYCYAENLNTYFNRFQVNQLSFTGLHYHTVVIILPLLSYTSYKEVSSLLYHSISRALNRVIILCNNQDKENLDNLFLLNATDFRVFDKLRQLQLVPREDFSTLNSEKEWKIALQILVVTKNKGPFISYVDLFTEKVGVASVFHALMRKFPWGEKGEILDMIETLPSSFNFIPPISEFAESFMRAAETLTLCSNIATRRDLLPRFKTIMNEHGVQTKSYVLNSFFFFPLSVVWADDEMFTLFINNLRENIETFSKLVAKVSSELDDDMREQFNCLIVSQHNIFTSTDTRQFFEKYSALSKKGQLQYSMHDLSEGLVKMINENHPVDQIFCGTNQTLKSITKIMFWDYVQSNYTSKSKCGYEPVAAWLNLPITEEPTQLSPPIITNDDLAVLSAVKTNLQNQLSKSPFHLLPKYSLLEINFPHFCKILCSSSPPVQICSN